MAKQSTLTVGKSGYALGSKLSNEDWDTLFTSKIQPALANGATMQSQREQYGPSEKIRQAARRCGYDTKGRKVQYPPIKVKGVTKAVLAKRINEARVQGNSWNMLRFRTGLARDEMTALLKAHGFDTVTAGRVMVSERGKAAQAKAEATKPAPKRTRRTRKAKVTA